MNIQGGILFILEFSLRTAVTYDGAQGEFVLQWVPFVFLPISLRPNGNLSSVIKQKWIVFLLKWKCPLNFSKLVLFTLTEEKSQQTVQK